MAGWRIVVAKKHTNKKTAKFVRSFVWLIVIVSEKIDKRNKCLGKM